MRDNGPLWYSRGVPLNLAGLPRISGLKQVSNLREVRPRPKETHRAARVRDTWSNVDGPKESRVSREENSPPEMFGLCWRWWSRPAAVIFLMARASASPMRRRACFAVPRRGHSNDWESLDHVQRGPGLAAYCLRGMVCARHLHHRSDDRTFSAHRWSCRVSAAPFGPLRSRRFRRKLLLPSPGLP